MTRTEPGDWLWPDWPAPPGVRAVSTSRNGGVSRAPWDSLNLGDHVDDRPRDVRENRRRLREALDLPAEPVWLRQVHGRGVAVLRGGERTPEADAAFTRVPGVVCAVLTADCLPVLFADTRGGAVAAAHAGWRGLAGGVLESTLGCFDDPGRVLAWLGPAIGPEAFEVGDEVRAAFADIQPEAAAAFRPHRPGRWLADIYALARLRLARAGLGRVFGGGHCTWREAGRFFSYRRDGITGRMASMIWFDEEHAGE